MNEESGEGNIMSYLIAEVTDFISEHDDITRGTNFRIGERMIC